MTRARSHSTRGKVLRAGLTCLASLLVAGPIPTAAADTTIGTANGITYVEDKTPPVPFGVQSNSPLVLARCPVGASSSAAEPA
jgi:hypothetical protein